MKSATANPIVNIPPVPNPANLATNAGDFLTILFSAASNNLGTNSLPNFSAIFCPALVLPSKFFTTLLDNSFSNFSPTVFIILVINPPLLAMSTNSGPVLYKPLIALAPKSVTFLNPLIPNLPTPLTTLAPGIKLVVLSTPQANPLPKRPNPFLATLKTLPPLVAALAPFSTVSSAVSLTTFDPVLAAVSVAFSAAIFEAFLLTDFNAAFSRFPLASSVLIPNPLSNEGINSVVINLIVEVSIPGRFCTKVIKPCLSIGTASFSIQGCI